MPAIVSVAPFSTWSSVFPITTFRIFCVGAACSGSTAGCGSADLAGSKNLAGLATLAGSVDVAEAGLFCCFEVLPNSFHFVSQQNRWCRFDPHAHAFQGEH